ncbi:MAG: bis(5'-nucleosyl)-tetraphosphatase (symmetrical) YqeK [Elusimicrobiota bacterium]|jgi:nicotinate-nucleotide adenylyltransferase|nr:bis(5'-nucleosyl)-tetraphosphatase (symmetrical) YqeK [Elusimicrobiota bacterium]
MNNSLEKDIFDYLSANLSDKRFDHSLNVANLAVELAKKNNVDIAKAQIAGLLHDCAKCTPSLDWIKFFKDKKKPSKYFKEISLFCPPLLHSFAGEIIAKENFKIKDKDILNAIKNHTLARENMSKLEKLVFVADATSIDRKFKNVSFFRKLAKKDIENAFLKLLTIKIKHNLERDTWICPQSITSWNWYISKLSNKS